MTKQSLSAIPWFPVPPETLMLGILFFSHLINLKLGLCNPSNIHRIRLLISCHPSSQAFHLYNQRAWCTCLFSWLSGISLISILTFTLSLYPLKISHTVSAFLVLFFSTLFPINTYWLFTFLGTPPTLFPLDEVQILDLEGPPKSCPTLPIPAVSSQVPHSSSSFSPFI